MTTTSDYPSRRQTIIALLFLVTSSSLIVWLVGPRSSSPEQQQLQQQQTSRPNNSRKLLLDQASSSLRHRRRNEAHDNSDSIHYHLLSSEEIHKTLLQWASDYPEFARVTTAQEAYGLQRAGRSSNDCPFDAGGLGCLNYILTIQDYTTHPENSESARRLPTVLWSGEVHGNERVGPTATMEAASLLLQAAACASKPRKVLKQQQQQEQEEAWQEAEECRQALQGTYGLRTERQLQWLARLVTTRRIVVVPTANALGYFRDTRWEGIVDVNRDFAFDVPRSTDCMRTIAARTLNEVFRQYMIQQALTFHAGREIIGYEWGNKSNMGYRSPDDLSQHEIAAAYSKYGGSFSTSGPYDYGMMNTDVYGVHGGMEDWAYAGFQEELATTCEPVAFGGYPKAKTTYEEGTLRAFNMLIETSDQKTPQSNLGTRKDILDANAEGNGHVPRNVRLCLLATDLVEPYLSITGVNDLDLVDDKVPMISRGTMGECQNAKRLSVPVSMDQVVVKWTVGGALTIDETFLYHGKWRDVSNHDVHCLSQPVGHVSAVLSQGISQNAASGTGYFSQQGPTPSSQNGVLGPVFEATVDLSSYQVGDEVVVLARARVDSSWTTQEGNIIPQVPPQSHIVNARTNPDWYYENENSVVEGRLDWYTIIPLTLVIGDADGSLRQVSSRWEEAEEPRQPSFGGTSCHSGSEPCMFHSECCSRTCLDSRQCLPSSRAGRGQGNGSAGGAGGGKHPI